jgi:Anti-sigma-28 factor, FlgM
MNRPRPRSKTAIRIGRVRHARVGPFRFTKGLAVNPQQPDIDVRQDLVARVRQEIQAGTYDTMEKLEAALDRLADRLTAD